MRGCTVSFASSYVCAKSTEVVRGSNVTQKPVPLRCLLMAGFHMVLKVFRMEKRMQQYYQSTLASQGKCYVRSKVILKLFISCERSKFSRLGRSHNSTTGVLGENSFYRFSWTLFLRSYYQRLRRETTLHHDCRSVWDSREAFVCWDDPLQVALPNSHINAVGKSNIGCLHGRPDTVDTWTSKHINCCTWRQRWPMGAASVQSKSVLILIKSVG